MAKNYRKQNIKFVSHKMVLSSSVKLPRVNSVRIAFHTFVFRCHQQRNGFIF